MRIAACGPALCGTIISLKAANDPDTGKPETDKHNVDASLRSRPMVGVQVVLGMKPSGMATHARTANGSGQVYNAEDGKTYSGNLTLQDANTIKLEGCIMGGLVCEAANLDSGRGALTAAAQNKKTRRSKATPSVAKPEGRRRAT